MSNPQAFPSTTEQYHGDGMTLRDYFAGQALIKMLDHKPEHGREYAYVARMCYEYAYAMLKERGKYEES